jgi:uncharacterized protein YdeI (YjbR/CyaY-like superfamily)
MRQGRAWTAKGDDQLEVLYDMDRAKWRKWLEKNHGQTASVFLVLVKKGARREGISYVEAVEEALCFGWIDSRPNALDEERFKIHMSPRRPKSIWSRSNKERVRRLIEQGLMTPAGMERVEAAKRNGSWDTIEDVEGLKVPDDLEEALLAHPPAKENFESFIASYKKQAIYWVLSAKRPETRAKRVEEIASSAAEKQKINQYVGKEKKGEPNR